jgi:hypothetical protein
MENPPAGLGRISPDGTINQFPLATANGPHPSLIRGSDGALWFSQRESIGRLAPQIVGVSLTQTSPAPRGRYPRFHLACRQLGQPCKGELRIELQPRSEFKAPVVLASLRYRLAIGASRVLPFELSRADFRAIIRARKHGTPVTAGAYEYGGYATSVPLRVRSPN